MSSLLFDGLLSRINNGGDAGRTPDQLMTTIIVFGGVLGYFISINYQQSRVAALEDSVNVNSLKPAILPWIYQSLKSFASSDLLTTVSTDSIHTQETIDSSLLVPYGPSPVNLDSDEDLNYYMKNLDMTDQAWREDPEVSDDKDKDTPDTWILRHKSLIRLTGRHPFNCEPPLKALYQKGFITPNALHYVRNHGPPPHIAWDKHRIHVTGLCPKPLCLSMADLLKLPRRSLPVTLVCCGNRRKEQNMIKQTIGFNWGAGGVSTGVWTGVRVSDILALAGVNTMDSSLHVRFASETSKGGDKLPGGIYGTSVPLQRAMDPSYDIILAFMYNGELLHQDHGFPVRLIVPGYIGGRMIKWLTDITVMSTESQDYYHFYDNRVLPSHVDAEKAKAEDWWHRPEYICNELNVNSAIAIPAHNDTLTLPTTTSMTTGNGSDTTDHTSSDSTSYKIQGYAYAGGGRAITRVEISLDSGAIWHTATLNKKERATEYGKHWCWLFWELDVCVLDLGNASEIVLRAWDESHNTQPMKPTWNVMGMLNNPWFRIKIHKNIDQESGVTVLTFEHPTLAGTQEGGWMTRLKGHPSLTTPWLHHEPIGTLVDTTNSAILQVDAVTTPSPTMSVAVFDPSKPSFSMEEVKTHNTETSAWIVIQGRVYDTTPYLKDHPGGADSILLNAGTDATEEFEAIHSKKAWKLLEEYYIGQLRPEGMSNSGASNTTTTTVASSSTTSSSSSMIALDPKVRIPFRLIEREVLSHDSLRLRFALQSANHVLGLPVGQHMFFSAKIDGKLVMRAYTPTTSDYDIGHFDLVIKVYSPNTTFPEGGKMSQYLGDMKVGEFIDVKGPLGHVIYEKPGRILISKKPFAVKKFAMLCGGTGITPIFQVIAAVLRDPLDSTEMFVLYANKTEEDILLHKELDQMAVAHPNRLQIHHVLSRSTNKQTNNNNSNNTSNNNILYGRINLDMVKTYLPMGMEMDAQVVALLCGPQALLDEACTPALKAHGYTDDRCVYF
eukprot:gene5810-11716_t